MIWVVVGDRAKIEAGLKELNLGGSEIDGCRWQVLSGARAAQFVSHAKMVADERIGI